jgi:hypothetical protein
VVTPCFYAPPCQCFALQPLPFSGFVVEDDQEEEDASDCTDDPSVGKDPSARGGSAAAAGEGSVNGKPVGTTDNSARGGCEGLDVEIGKVSKGGGDDGCVAQCRSYCAPVFVRLEAMPLLLRQGAGTEERTETKCGIRQHSNSSTCTAAWIHNGREGSVKLHRAHSRQPPAASQAQFCLCLP